MQSFSADERRLLFATEHTEHTEVVRKSNEPVEKPHIDNMARSLLSKQFFFIGSL